MPILTIWCHVRSVKAEADDGMVSGSVGGTEKEEAAMWQAMLSGSKWHWFGGMDVFSACGRQRRSNAEPFQFEHVMDRDQCKGCAKVLRPKAQLGARPLSVPTVKGTR